MRMIRAKERERAGNIYCPFCKQEGRRKVDAIWRRSGLSGGVACEAHKHELQDADHLGRYSEADHQTWMRL